MLTAVKSNRPTPALTRVIPSRGGGSVSAVTSLGDDVFVVRCESQQVEVYNAVTLTLQRRLEVPGLGKWPIGLVACPNNNCLYVSEYRYYLDRVHRVDLSGSNAVKEWAVAPMPRGLSINREHHLIVVCHTGIASKLQEYTTHALKTQVSPGD